MEFPQAPATHIDLDQYPSVLALFNESIERHADRVAFQNFGSPLTYRDLSDKANQIASWLQHDQGVKPGDKYAIMLPNCLQYPVFALALMRVGAVLVNVNPLYTPRELIHQMNDSQAVGIIVLANMAETVEKALPDLNIRSIVVTELADLMPTPKRLFLNFAVKYLKKMVPPFELPGHYRLLEVLQSGPHPELEQFLGQHDDVLALQYTGGTTGVAKGAVLTNRNILANMMQIDLLFDGTVRPGMTAIAPLPMYHVFSFVGHMMWLFKCGVTSVLITNPRDMPTFMKLLEKTPFDIFIGLNTLFVGLLKQERFHKLDFSRLRLTVSGGMALTTVAANEWQRLTDARSARAMA